METTTTQTIWLGGGCFWCIEPIFDALKGVLDVQSGYSGGKTLNPTYRDICTGTTDHAEVIQVQFDSSIISLDDLLRIFFTYHDPTTLNRQGNDKGTQYRSVIFYETEEQKVTAEEIIQEFEKSGLWGAKIVTEITKFARFYVAENYHQDYYKLHGYEPYCQIVISPKVAKFRKEYRNWIRD